MDQPCRFRFKSTEPKTIVEGEYKMSREELEEFYRKGYSRPYTAVSEEEMKEFEKEIVTQLAQESKAFGINTVRDRHLDAPFLLNLFRHPAITERLAQLLGPDLLIWRSQVFNQEAGAPPITWHQASTYMLEDFKRPILKPRNKNELFQLTVWIAVDNATVENGCIRFIPGTHDRIRKIHIGGKNKFYQAAFHLDVGENPEMEYRPLRPGQFVIFSERTIHGNAGNRTDSRRMGINFRAITTDTSVYSGVDKHYAQHLKTTWDLKNWGVIQLRGKDEYKLSKTFEAPQETLTS
ncbi:MAG TPA: phytanoyl-CoA dioxygenase family protein [Flavilitoribacter sp.]|nr:phytanoyl-CoA dioxygenase family protein [Flavilitoribacter sp.]HMQ89926.1 phytanoyl-CoA dioxygenase family protein [Flavilitoribacter sp.]